MVINSVKLTSVVLIYIVSFFILSKVNQGIIFDIKFKLIGSELSYSGIIVYVYIFIDISRVSK